MSLADELARIAELHRDGSITDAEYAIAKARLLEPDSATRPAPTPREPASRRGALDDGRLVLAGSSVAIVVSLFLPWLDLVLIRVSGFDLLRLSFGIDRAVRNLSGVFGSSAGGNSGLRVAAVLLAILLLATITAPLWRSSRFRALQAFAGATLLLGFAVFTMLRANEGPLEILGAGAWLFLLATVTTQCVAAVLTVRGSLRLDSADDRILPIRIATSPNGRRVAALVVGPVLFVSTLHWFLYPDASSGPVVVEYELAAFGLDGWEPQRAANVEINAVGSPRTVQLLAPASTPSQQTVTRLPAGRWASGERVTITYVPSLSSDLARILGLEGLSQFDEGARLSVNIPSQPSWRARFGQQELIIRVSVQPGRTTVVVDHDDFGQLDRRSLRRANEPLERELLRLEQERQARIDREVRESCRALERQWRATFASFNQSDETLYVREWGYQGVTRPYRDWARRARNMRNGLVDPYNATSARDSTMRAQDVPGGQPQISAINNRARSAIAAQRQAIDRYIDHWESVYRAAQLESASLWRSREGEIAQIRARARAGATISFGC